MGKLDAIDTAAMCGGKDPMTFEVASQVAQRMSRRGKRVVPFQCLACGFWHIGGVKRG